MAYAIKSLDPKIKVYGVQAAGAPSMYNSIRDKKIERLETVSTIADGIAVKEPGENTFRIISEYVDDIVTVTDDEISAAILALMEQQKLVTEGAGAVSVAAAMFNKVPIKGKKTVCLLSGGNIDVTILSRVIKRGLLMTGRTYSMNIELIDKPGQLMDVSRIIAQLGGNVISIHHERANEGSAVNGCYLRIVLETRNYEHIEEIKKASEMKFTVDEDAPELTLEQYAEMAELAKARRRRDIKPVVSLRISPDTLEKAKSTGKGYTGFLSRLLDNAINDPALVKRSL